MTAFSNATEFEYWTPNWCSRCTEDETGTGPDGAYCPILTAVMADNEVPDQWKPGTDDLRDRYHCTEFKGTHATH